MSISFWRPSQRHRADFSQELTNSIVISEYPLEFKGHHQFFPTSLPTPLVVHHLSPDHTNIISDIKLRVVAGFLNLPHELLKSPIGLFGDLIQIQFELLLPLLHKLPTLRVEELLGGEGGLWFDAFMQGQQFGVARVEHILARTVSSADSLILGELDRVLDVVLDAVSVNLEGEAWQVAGAVDGAVGAAERLRDEGGLEVGVFSQDGPIQKAENRATCVEFDLVIREFGIRYFSVLHSYINGFELRD